jgi:L-lactate dehydrogenase complex protein LldG
MERTAFLGRVRDRLEAGPHPQPPVIEDWDVEIDDPVARFERELKAIGGDVRRAGRAEAASVLERWPGATVVATSEADLPPDLDAVVARSGGEMLSWPRPVDEVAARAEVGVTSALWGVAETGSLLLSSSPPGGRAPSLVVPTHVVFIPAERILATVSEVFDRISELEKLPSNLVLITGPSKSADIGMELIQGIHGPGELYVVVLEEPG